MATATGTGSTRFTRMGASKAEPAAGAGVMTPIMVVVVDLWGYVSGLGIGDKTGIVNSRAASAGVDKGS